MSIDDRIEDAVRDTERWRKIARRRNAAEEEILEALTAAKRELAARREQLRTLREEDRRPEKREELADLIDELEAQIDLLVERLDVRQRKSANAEAALERNKDRVQRLRRRRREIEASRGDLTAHFSAAEFGCRDGTPVPSAALAALRAWCESIGEPLRERFGAVHVNSGYRTASYNAAIGGASDSVHIYDRHPNAVAVDITCERGTPREWFEFTAGRADGRGLYSTFHHADNRNRIGWPDAVWSG